MRAIVILTSCAVKGRHLEAGIQYAVPAEVGESDAATLVRIGKAVPADPPAPRKRKAKA